MADVKRDIELIDTNDMLHELARRHPDGLLLLRITVKDDVEMFWRGRKLAAIGMAEYAKRRLFQLLVDAEES